MRHPAEISWQAMNAVDIAQTVDASHDPQHFRETGPAGLVLGKHPSDGRLAVWAVGAIAGHALVSNWLLENDHPRLFWAWQFVTFAESTSSVAQNIYVGVRIGAPNSPR